MSERERLEEPKTMHVEVELVSDPSMFASYRIEYWPFNTLERLYELIKIRFQENGISTTMQDVHFKYTVLPKFLFE